ncbi:MAG: hypothetical protein JXA57_07140, partial [Armatimonadetes bacterium]|nr:hypothetical protein [Armatimonadota bacterium]
YVVPPAMAALVQAARSLATAVDSQPHNAGLWARYQQALAQLAPLVAEAEDRVFEKLLQEINSRAPATRD